MAIGLSRISVAALASCLIAVPAYGQEPTPAAPAPAPAHLAYVDGAVDVVQDGVTERADPPLMLIEGDIVRTRSGRAEIVFGDGTLLHLAHQTELEILADDHLRLPSGRVIVRLSHAAARPYVIDTPASSVRLEAEGEYSVASDRAARLEVAVTRGTATLSDGASWTVGGGQRITLAAAGARPLIESFNTARWDAFSQWASDRVDGLATSSSAAQLPYQLRPYAPVLDHYGRWDYLAPHGYVWVPSVSVGWRPYYDGSWSFTRYGWTWRGRERWAWPTHHYGRWGFNGVTWYWVPATVWAPAWVSWSLTPGYVSWAPLGWYGSVGANVWGRRDHPVYAPDNPWRGWTVVRRDHFAPRRHVRTFAVDGNRLDVVTQRTLTSQAAVPRAEPRAVQRDSVTTPGSRGNVRRPASGNDHPAYAPRTTPSVGDRRGTVPESGDRRGAGRNTDDRRGDTQDRRGAVREPRGRDAAPRDTSPREPARVTPRAGPSNAPQDTPRTTERSGAVRRGDGARTPSRGTPPPAAQTAPPAGQKPPAAGGARRRPGP